MDTIFAQCSARGKAGVAVFRISGEKSIESLEKLIGAKTSKLKARQLYFRKIYHPVTKQLIDEAMVVFFSGNSSFTGEDSVEIHTHGSLAVIKMLNEVLESMPDLRLAEGGEFSRRSFLNGKMDLTAAEGLADLIDAETELQHKQAINQLGGGLEALYEQWRAELLALISLLEAYIDFPDEDIPEETLQQVKKSVENLINKIKAHLDDNNRGERLRSGLKLAILGKPNVGKSSLLNYLMRRDVAIISNIAGTTRDVIEGHLDIGGYPIILQDTAGIHDGSSDLIEIEGIERAKKISQNSDIKIIMYDIAETAGLRALEEKDNVDYFSQLVDENTIILLNKTDISEINETTTPSQIHGKTPIKVSVKKNMGMENLMNSIISIAEKIAKPSDSPQITRARHRVQLEQALESLTRFSLNDDLVLATEDIRISIRALCGITGKITVDEILGEIFSNFCIGK
ncbi:MAG: tRNA uridine-5-carboxymethylaminomethyl(34) synthesis GTPase MnmE [Rickettsiales bacterium]|nr:MAG: tRNA uridine-5-carboxymethylaminomethyl(34) synthesis GTPase MnmE [Rickettsiales bacterium]